MVISRLDNNHGGLTVISPLFKVGTGAGYLDPEIELKTAHGKEAKRILLVFIIFEVNINFSEKGTATLKVHDVMPGPGRAAVTDACLNDNELRFNIRFLTVRDLW